MKPPRWKVWHGLARGTTLRPGRSGVPLAICSSVNQSESLTLSTA